MKLHKTQVRLWSVEDYDTQVINSCEYKTLDHILHRDKNEQLWAMWFTTSWSQSNFSKFDWLQEFFLKSVESKSSKPLHAEHSSSHIVLLIIFRMLYVTELVIYKMVQKLLPFKNPIIYITSWKSSYTKILWIIAEFFKVPASTALHAMK